MTKAARATDRRKWIHVRLPPWRREEVPEGTMEFAQERVSYLQGVSLEEPLIYLLACAYLQGINDCVYAHDRNPDLGRRVDGEDVARCGKEGE